MQKRTLVLFMLTCLVCLAAFTFLPETQVPPDIGPAFPVAPHPTRLAWDGDTLWVISQLGKNVQQLNPDTGEIMSAYFGGDYPQDLLYADDAIWLAIRGGNMVQKINPQDQTHRAYPAPIAPRSLTYDPQHNTIWVACSGYDLLRQFDAESGERLPGISKGVIDEPRLLVWDGSGLWVAGESGLQYIDPQNGKTREYDLPGYVYDMLWDGTYLWLTTALDYRLVRISPDGQQDMYTAGQRPYALAWDGERLWVSDYLAGSILQVSPVDGTVENSLEIGYRPHDLLWSGDRLWIADINGDRVQWIKP